MESDDGFDVSPDGSRIAYADGGDLTVLDLASGESSKLGAADDWVWAGNDRLLVTVGLSSTPRPGDEGAARPATIHSIGG